VKTRRAFLVWYIGGLMAAIVTAVSAPLAVYLFPARGLSKPRPITVPVGQALNDFPEGAAFHFDSPANSAFVMRDGGGVNSPGDVTFGGFLTRVNGRLQCLAITCPHLGCSYALDPGGKDFTCPCHGSRFSLSGQVLQGPATSPLSHLTFRPGDQLDTILVEGVGVAQ
jgi:Rieske Fe-S protein